MKKAGIVTAIGVSTIALITGLALGLKRKGKDIIANAKHTSKITPVKKTKRKRPWSTIEEATGGSLVFIGDNLYLIIGAGVFYVSIKALK